ncbi:MAG: CDP-glucose 4,6-dehydratase [Paracoccaceae bacterium]|nr:CDP-glucose 4,6-dehydratase [Paracoccaceae bacterium]
MFGGVYNSRRVLVTGHTGFKGSWLCKWLEILGAEIAGYSLAPITNPNHFELSNLKVKSYIHDIRDYDLIRKVMADFKPEFVFHLAAQPSVLESYNNPLDTYSTNVMGSANVLEATRHTDSVKSVVVVTTDKVYRNNEWNYCYRENDELGGHDPYSASKASTELVTESYRKSFSTTNTDMPLIASARAGNVVGGGDWTENRIIKDAVIAASKDKKVLIRNPNSSRPWQHVLEPLSGYLLLGQHLHQRNFDIVGSWNFGPALSANLTVKDLVQLMGEQWDKVVAECHIDSNAKYEAQSLMIDSTKARSVLGWKPIWDIKRTVQHTIKWYRTYLEKNLVITTEQIRNYVSEAKENNLSWAD